MKHFTYEEAQARIPELEKIFELADDIRAKAQAKLERIQELEKAKPGDPAQLAIERSQVEFLAQCLEQALKGIEAMGAVLKGVEPALVDFPHTLAGKEVYLCWTEGEKELTHFHGVEEGFSGRRPLPKRSLPH